MNQNDVVLIVLGVLGTAVTFGLPIVTALWKLSSLRERMTDQIQEVNHRLDMLTSKVENLDDKVTLGVNGLKELIDHRSIRLNDADKRHEGRINELEGWLVKNTAFERRDRG
jgi:hypothetical protein